MGREHAECIQRNTDKETFLLTTQKKKNDVLERGDAERAELDCFLGVVSQDGLVRLALKDVGQR